MDADRPNLQLAFGSAKEERRKYTSEQEAGYCCSKPKQGGPRLPLEQTPGLVSSLSLGYLAES